jgi:hypothetical protein
MPPVGERSTLFLHLSKACRIDLGMNLFFDVITFPNLMRMFLTNCLRVLSLATSFHRSAAFREELKDKIGRRESIAAETFLFPFALGVDDFIWTSS